VRIVARALLSKAVGAKGKNVQGGTTAKMSRDQVYGWIILVVSLAIILGYIWAVFFPPMVGLDTLVIKFTGVAAIGFGFGIMAWIGYTLATTPPPEPIDMSEFEKKVEEPTPEEKAPEEKAEAKPEQETAASEPSPTG